MISRFLKAKAAPQKRVKSSTLRKKLTPLGFPGFESVSSTFLVISKYLKLCRTAIVKTVELKYRIWYFFYKREKNVNASVQYRFTRKIINFLKFGHTQREASTIFSINKMTVNTGHFRCEKLPGKKCGQYDQRTNIIAGFVNHKAIDTMVFNGSCTTKVFETWVENVLIKELKPRQVVVMDNASFHQ